MPPKRFGAWERPCWQRHQGGALNLDGKLRESRSPFPPFGAAFNSLPCMWGWPAASGSSSTHIRGSSQGLWGPISMRFGCQNGADTLIFEDSLRWLIEMMVSFLYSVCHTQSLPPHPTHIAGTQTGHSIPFTDFACHTVLHGWPYLSPPRASET